MKTLSNRYNIPYLTRARYIGFTLMFLFLFDFSESVANGGFQLGGAIRFAVFIVSGIFLNIRYYVATAQN